MLGMAHPLHRRRVSLGIQKIRDEEKEQVSREGGREEGREGGREGGMNTLP